MYFIYGIYILYTRHTVFRDTLYIKMYLHSTELYFNIFIYTVYICVCVLGRRWWFQRVTHTGS